RGRDFPGRLARLLDVNNSVSSSPPVFLIQASSRLNFDDRGKLEVGRWVAIGSGVAKSPSDDRSSVGRVFAQHRLPIVVRGRGVQEFQQRVEGDAIERRVPLER